MRVSLLTVGHAPRDDLVPDLAGLLDDRFVLRQRGALDHLATGEILEQHRPRNGGDTLVTRLRDGSMHTLCSATVLPLVQRAILEEGGAGDAVVVLCTGAFPRFHCPVPLLVPHALLHGAVPPMAGGMRVGALLPLPTHAQAMLEDWRREGLDVTAACVRSPGTPEDLREAAGQMGPIDLLVLDCIGYTAQTRDMAARIFGVPVIHPKTLLAQFLRLLAGGGCAQPTGGEALV